MKISSSNIEYITNALNWSKACFDEKRNFMNCLFCYMQRFRDPKTKPDPNEGTEYWINDEIGELVRQLKRGFKPKGNWMLCTSHDPLSNHSYKVCYRVLSVLRSFRAITGNMMLLSKRLGRIIPIASAEQIPMNALYGATLTTLSQRQAEEYQPGTDPVMKQLEALRCLHALGYRTWVSLEPCFSFMNIPRVLEQVPNVELAIIGKLNKVSGDPQYYETLTKEQFRIQIAQARSKFPNTKILIKNELERWMNSKKRRNRH